MRARRAAIPGRNRIKPSASTSHPLVEALCHRFPVVVPPLGQRRRGFLGPRRERFSEFGIHGWLLRFSYLTVMPVPWRRSASYLQICTKNREPTSGLDPLTCSSYECAVRGCRGLHGLANAAYLSDFLRSGLLRVAPYCVPDGIRVVSGRATATV